MARPGRDRSLGAKKQHLIRLLKAARDGDVSAANLAAIADTRRGLKHSAVAEACQAVGKPEWIRLVASGSLDEALAPQPVVPAGPRTISDSQPSDLDLDLDLESEPPTGMKPDDRERRLGPAVTRNFKAVEFHEVLAAHVCLVDYFKYSRDPIDPPGLKNEDLLQSALSRQHTSYNGLAKYRTLPHLAGALIYGLALNHPFHNGNKRTALLTLMLLLDKNDYVLTAHEDELFEFVLKVVNHGFRPARHASPTELHDFEVRAIASWISAHCRRVDRRLRPIDWRELRRRLKDLGAETQVLKGNFIEITRNGQRLNLSYGGDDREVSKPTIKHIWRDLGLEEVQVYDAAAFYGSGAPVDRFIVKYLEVFRKLAHA